MPLFKGRSKAVKHKNFLELTTGAVGSTRRKAIRTLMRRRGVSYEKARALQAKAIISK